MDFREYRSMIDRGGLLLVSEPEGSKTGAKLLIRRIRAWISEAGSVNGGPENSSYREALTDLSVRLEEKANQLTRLTASED